MKKLGLIIFFDTVALMLIGLITVLSASSGYSEFKFDSIFHLFNNHLFKVIFGFFVMLFFCIINYNKYKQYTKQALLLICFVLMLTLVLAPNIKGAGRWINLGFFSFQPADAAKLILILHLAVLIENKEKVLGNFKHGFLYLFFWVLIVAGLIFAQPNVSTAILIVVVSLIMLFVGGARIFHIAGSAFATFATAAIAAMIIPHSRGRILSYINHVNSGSDINIQVKQAVLGLGSGGLFGVGMGHSRQSNLFLPEAYGDFIFAILGEETGFIGTVILLLLYLTFFTAGILIAKKTRDKYGQMLAFGITFAIALNAFINIAVATGLVPTTGLPLPFISYGGTSIIFLSISVGILINIAFKNSNGENPEINFPKKYKYATVQNKPAPVQNSNYGSRSEYTEPTETRSRSFFKRKSK